MKKMLLATALALLITGCAQQTFTVQNRPAAVTETITHHFFVSGIGQKKTVDAAKICGGAENVVKTETQQTFVNGLLGFITLGIYAPLEALCVLLTIIACCPSIWATLSALLINILLGSFQLFLHSDQPLSEGEIIPFSGVCQSGEAALSTPEAVVASRTDLRQTAFNVQPTTTSGNIITQSIIFSFSIDAPSCILPRRSNITLTHLHVSNCRVNPASSLAFLSLGFVGNGVITVMINSP